MFTFADIKTLAETEFAKVKGAISTDVREFLDMIEGVQAKKVAIAAAVDLLTANGYGITPPAAA
jgi:hypothetical protein